MSNLYQTLTPKSYSQAELVVAVGVLSRHRHGAAEIRRIVIAPRASSDDSKCISDCDLSPHPEDEVEHIDCDRDGGRVGGEFHETRVLPLPGPGRAMSFS